MMHTPNKKGFFGHPSELATLFHLELWERFSFYGMQAILMIYLYFSLADGGLGMDKALAGGIVGAYGGSIYLATLGGGWVADRLLGLERTLFYSAWLIMAGHVVLALTSGLSGLFFGLLLIALGSGGVKAPISAMVGSLYDEPSMRALRDAGFSIFYIAINIGALFGPLLTGILQSRVGFHYAFGAAAVGMALGLILYARGRAALMSGAAINPLEPAQKQRLVMAAVLVMAALAAAIALDWLRLDNIKMVLLGVVITLAIAYFVRLLQDKRLTVSARRQLMAYAPLFVCICIFWALWMQNYTLLVVYFESTVNRILGGFEVPVAWQASMQGFWVIALAGVMSALWQRLGRHAPSTPVKFGLSLIIMAATFMLYVPFISSEVPMSMTVYMLSLAVLTVAELMISPISMALATKIAPPFFRAQMVGLNFLALSIGVTLGGVLFAKGFDETAPLAYYQLLIGIGLVAGVVFLLMAPILKRWLKDEVI